VLRVLFCAREGKKGETSSVNSEKEKETARLGEEPPFDFFGLLFLKNAGRENTCCGAGIRIQVPDTERETNETKEVITFSTTFPGGVAALRLEKSLGGGKKKIGPH